MKARGMDRRTWLILILVVGALAGAWIFKCKKSSNQKNEQNSSYDEFFRFPSQSTASPDQLRQLSEIRSKYSSQLNAVNAGLEAARAGGQMPQEQIEFYRFRELQIREEITKSIEALLSAEQRREIMLK